MKQHLWPCCDSSRRPVVHGAEETLLSAHPAAGLGRPPLEAVLRRTQASQSSEKWCDHWEPVQRRVQLAEDDGYGHRIRESTNCSYASCASRLLWLFCLRSDRPKGKLTTNKYSSHFFLPSSFFSSFLFSSLVSTAKLAAFYGGTTWTMSHLMQLSN